MKRHMYPLAMGCAALSLVLSGCGGSADAADASDPTVLKLGVPPGETDPQFLERMQPIADDIAAVTGKEVEVTKTNDYLAIVEAMRSGLLDVAIFSPTPAILAEEVANTDTIVAALGAPYTSEVVCRPDAGVTTVADVQDTSIAFVDAGSTSGNYVPRFMLKNEGLDVDNLDETFAGGHDSALLALKQGSVDCAAVATSQIDTMIGEEMLAESDFERIAKSDPIPISMAIITRDGLSEDITSSIADTMIENQSPALLEVTGATEIVYPEDTDWSLFEGIVKDLGVGLGDSQ